MPTAAGRWPAAPLPPACRCGRPRRSRAAPAPPVAARRPITQAWVDEEAANEVVDAAYRAFGVTAKVTPVRGGCRIELVVKSETELAAFAGRLGEVAELVETHILR